MKFTRVIALVVMVASLGVTAANAQNLRNAGQPAEFPPASYKGTQYVDSRGCVYVRAGISGNVTWIPRVTRARDQICGQTPSIAGYVTTAVPEASEVVPPVQITLDSPRETPDEVVETAAAPNGRKVAKVAALKPKPRRTTSIRTPKTMAKVAKPIATPATTPVVRRARTGPQQQVVYADAAAQNINGSTRVVPKHVQQSRLKRKDFQVPKGYYAVWDDDRMNLERAVQTLEGHARTQLVWTQTVPRRLVVAGTGRDVTTSIPLVYPYVDMSTQTKELGKVSVVLKDGKVVKRILRNKNTAKLRAPVVSSRSAPAVNSAKVKATTPKIVHVGTFDQKRRANSVAQRVQRMGLPVRIGKFTRSGRTYRMVLAGPFGPEATQALAHLRAAGYRDAAFR